MSLTACILSAWMPTFVTRKTARHSTFRSYMFLASLVVALLSPALVDAQAFIPTGNLNDARHSHAAVGLKDGRVLVVGGYGSVFGCCEVLKTAEIYDPITQVFTRTGNMAQARVKPMLILLPSGKVLVAGGEGPVADGGHAALASTELYDPDTGTFSPSGSMAHGRRGSTGTLLPDGTVLLAGGADELFNFPADAETFDPTTGIFSLTGPMPEARWQHAAARLPNGGVLLAGGCVYDCSNRGLRYDPQTRTFALTSVQVANRVLPAAAPLADGRVIVLGGYDASGEIYDDATATFTYAAPMIEFRQGRDAASILPSGRILVTGWSSTAELFDIASGFSPTATMQSFRDQHTATELSDGTVLIVGGAASFPFPLSSAELYDETYEDTIAPTLNVPGSVTAVATDPTGTAVFFYVSATDSIDPNPVVECSPPSGTQFAIGATQVNCVATDAGGNMASGSFVVTVMSPLEVSVTFPTAATVDPRTGLVTIGGSVSCNRPATGFLSGSLTQTIARRAVLTGYFQAYLDCSGSGNALWTATTSASNGRFSAGKASVTSSTSACDTFSCTNKQESVTILLRGN